MKKVKSVDEFFENQDKWKVELNYLRSIFNKTELEEKLKWGMPTYCINNKNVVGIGSFKNHYGIWFFNGVLLKDTHKLLQNAQENTQAMRQLKFNAETKVDENIVLEYVLEAIENQKQGKEFKFEKKKELVTPKYFEDELKKNSTALRHFNDFSASKKRDYIEWFEEAKTDATKQKRITTAIEWISEGKPRMWKYMKAWK